MFIILEVINITSNMNPGTPQYSPQHLIDVLFEPSHCSSIEMLLIFEVLGTPHVAVESDEQIRIPFHILMQQSVGRHHLYIKSIHARCDLTKDYCYTRVLHPQLVDNHFEAVKHVVSGHVVQIATSDTEEEKLHIRISVLVRIDECVELGESSDLSIYRSSV